MEGGSSDNGELIIVDEYSGVGNNEEREIASLSSSMTSASTKTTVRGSSTNVTSKNNTNNNNKENIPTTTTTTPEGDENNLFIDSSNSSEDPFGLDIEVINNHRKSLSINSFTSLNEVKTTTPQQHQQTTLPKRYVYETNKQTNKKTKIIIKASILNDFEMIDIIYSTSIIYVGAVLC